jgi:hypothetical protein
VTGLAVLAMHDEEPRLRRTVRALAIVALCRDALACSRGPLFFEKVLWRAGLANAGLFGRRSRTHSMCHIDMRVAKGHHRLARRRQLLLC